MSFISYHGAASWCEAIGLSHVASLLPSWAERVSCVRGCSFIQTFLTLEHALTPNPSLPLVAPSQDPPSSSTTAAVLHNTDIAIWAPVRFRSSFPNARARGRAFLSIRARPRQSFLVHPHASAAYCSFLVQARNVSGGQQGSADVPRSCPCARFSRSQDNKGQRVR